MTESEPDSQPTIVVFRRFRGKYLGIIALFPELPSDTYGYRCESYMHVGQHSGADYELVIEGTRPVPDPRHRPDQETRELMAELQGLGYVLAPRQRCTPAMRRARMDEATRIRNWRPDTPDPNTDTRRPA
jgi:hypothetical protein